MTVPFWKFMAKEVKMTSSFCYNDQDFREVMENVGQGEQSPSHDSSLS